MSEKKGSFQVKSGLAQMLKGGVIMDVSTPEQAVIARKPAPAPLWLWSRSGRYSS